MRATMLSHSARTLRAFTAALALMVASCSDLTVPDLNNPGLGDLQANPTRAGIVTAATGLLVGARANWGSQNGPVAILGIVGREGYNFDAADPRFVTSMLIGPLSGGDPAFGGNLWGLHYLNIRNAHIVINATNAIVTDPSAGLTAGEKAGVLGFAKTIKAYELMNVIGSRDTAGAPIDVDRDPTADPAPIATRAEVYAYIQSLLDSAYTHLTTAGASFPFALTSGFTGFSTPTTFATANRALRARAAVYTDDFAAALTALGQSFVDTLTRSLSDGIYHTFSTGSGDVTNALFDPDARALHAHPSMETDAQLQPGGARDQRFLNKIDSLFDDAGNHDTNVVQGIPSHLVPAVYGSPTAPIPIIRNEELILLRAEANIMAANLTAALDDINYIRVNSGGLAPYAGVVDAPSLRTELLYNKRYSLFWEGGHRWRDLRHYGLLNTLPQALVTHRRFSRFPFPINECTPRATQPAGCADNPGF